MQGLLQIVPAAARSVLNTARHVPLKRFSDEGNWLNMILEEEGLHK
jgi:hypothetical protein